MSLSQTTILGLTPVQVINAVGTIASIAATAFAPGLGTVAGMSIQQLTGLAVGVANRIPEAIAAFDEIKSVQASGQAPTAEQWAKWNAAADDAHAQAQAAADKVIADGNE